MGIQQSSFQNLSDNKLIAQLVEQEHIAREKLFWDELLDFDLISPLNRDDVKKLKGDIKHLCASLCERCASSGNFTTLASVAVFHIRELITNASDQSNDERSRKCRNVLLLIRCCCEYFAEHLSDEDLLARFNTLPAFDGQPTVFDEFLLVLSEVISFIPVTSSMYNLHFEAVTTLLTLLSTQMFRNKLKTDGKVFMTILNSKCSANAIPLVRTCLHNYIKNETSTGSPQGMASWAASGFWSMFTTSESDSVKSIVDSLNPLASHSYFLLLVLAFNDSKGHNVYRDALLECAPGKSSGDKNSETKDCSFTLNFNRLYFAITRDLDAEATKLLLYLMLHRNVAFGKFILRQKDIQNVVLPLLHVLYNAEQNSTHSIYMALISVLIFTQEDGFNTHIHEVTVNNITWYKDRNISAMTLGSLIVLVLTRTIQFNMAKMRDKYLHTNCLASLANMAGTFKCLHPIATQKIISLCEQLMKRHAKLASKNDEFADDVIVLEEIIYMMMEIMNACLVANIAENANLVFALLRNKELFDSLRTKARFSNILANIDQVISYFGSIVDERAKDNCTPDDILRLITDSSQDWPRLSLKKFSPLMFKYLEEEAAEEFFVPYIWSLVHRHAFMHWNDNRIMLFLPNS